MRNWTTLAAVALGVGIGALVTMQAQQQRGQAPALTALDYIQIQQLVAHYSYALDTGADDGYMYADLFAPDGVMRTGGRDVKGRDDLARLVRINPNPSPVGRNGQPVDTTFPSPNAAGADLGSRCITCRNCASASSSRPRLSSVSPNRRRGAAWFSGKRWTARSRFVTAAIGLSINCARPR